MSLVYLDTETTGLDPAVHEVWEIAYAVDDGPVETSVVEHNANVLTASAAALDIGNYFSRGQLIGHRRSDLAKFETGLKKVLEGATLVGANPAFDAAFLRARWGAAPWRYRLLDIEAYAMPALKLDEPRGLAYIAEQLGVDPPDHSAAEDVRALRDCHRILAQRYSEVAW